MKNQARAILLAASLAAVGGCHGNASNPATVYLEAARLPKPPAPVVKEIVVPVATPQLRSAPTTRPSTTRPTAHDTIVRAKSDATQSARSDDFVRATQVYDYLPDVVYEVVATPGHVTTIELERGEQLLAKAAGDTAQWSVGDSRAGSGGDVRTLVIVKPLKPGVKTNLVLSTDRRIYQIDLVSTSAVYHSEVRWNYPHDLALQLAAGAKQPAAVDEVIEPAVKLADLDFGYRVRVKGKSTPDWMPRRVFTDGRKTYLAFPHDLDATEAPPLFVLGRRDEAQLVNYRVQGGYYVVDQVIRRAELRLGQSPQDIVVIEKIRD
jgi:P-type conjugative transfer protein TrbG